MKSATSLFKFSGKASNFLANSALSISIYLTQNHEYFNGFFISPQSSCPYECFPLWPGVSPPHRQALSNRPQDAI